MQPLMRDCALRHEPADRAGKLRSKSRSLVLVVDDVPSDATLLRAILVSAGYDVLVADDGLTALQVAQESKPNLILLDVVMPGLDGFAVCSRLKGDESTRHIPVIFVIGNSDGAAEARGFELGAADYILKPILAPTVLARVKTHLALDRQRRHLEGMFRDVIEFAPEAFIVADMQGSIVQINARTEELFGYKRQELTGIALRTLMPQCAWGAQDDDAEPMAAVASPCVRKDGSEFPGDINLSSMQTNRGRMLVAVVRDVSERQKAQLELAQSRQQLRELAAQNESRREGERKHIAREVHDELGQVLTALRMDMSLLGLRLGAIDSIVADHVLRMKTSVDRAIQAVRNVAANLRPTALDMGLVAAIEWLSSEFTERTAIACVLDTSDEALTLDETRDVVVFRIVQESLTNIARYANASQVRLALVGEATALRVEVHDNGCGFDPAGAARTKSFGLLGMRERALALGGSLDINSGVGRGTLISVVIPFAVNVSKANE